MKTVHLHSKLIPYAGTYDIMVAGGGFGGFAAAVTAARAGMRVLLVERSGQLGGVATLAGVANFCTAGEPLQGHGKLWDEVIDTLHKMHAIGEQYGFLVKHNTHIPTVDYSFSPSMLVPVLLHIAQKSGVHLLFQTDVVDAIVEDGSVRYWIIHNESLLQAVEAKIFIDGTGHGTAALHSGAQMLPEDGAAIPPAFRIFLHKGPVDDPTLNLDDMPASPLPYAVQFLADGSAVLKINLKGVETTDAISRNNVELAVRLRVLATVRDFQNKYGADYYYDGVPALLGSRETRRIEGEYVLTQSDVRSGKQFDDGVVTSSYIIDTVYEHEIVPSYQIPYRCLLAKQVENLLVVGRCFSADRYAMSSARTMMTICQMGAAAGAAAALACCTSTPLRQIASSDILPMI